MDSQADTYTIIVDGPLDASWAEWLGGWQVTPAPGRSRPATIVQGSVPDQAALRGILNRLWDLNLSIVSVTRQEG